MADTCPHPQETLSRFRATCAWIDASGIACGACGAVLRVHFSPHSDSALAPSIDADAAWCGGPHALDLGEARARSLPEVTLGWERVALLLPPQSAWRYLD